MEWSGRWGVSPVLALDTSTRVASVAVLGPTCDVEAEGKATSRSDDLVMLIDRVLTDSAVGLAEVAGIAVGVGPGSFTGLRIGMATAKGLCFAVELPMWSVSSLAALALDAGAAAELAGALVIPVFDARRGEVCAGFYRVAEDRAESLAEERIIEPSLLAAVIAEVRDREGDIERVLLVGDALDSHGVALSSVGQPLSRARVTPSARSIARLALSGPRTDVLRTGTPVYIRPSAAEVAFPDGNPGSRLTVAPPEKK
jgi:tRNA threonylcarbamoyladenosine biosynthesis protein TsaB